MDRGSCAKFIEITMELIWLADLTVYFIDQPISERRSELLVVGKYFSVNPESFLIDTQLPSLNTSQKPIAISLFRLNLSISLYRNITAHG